MKARKSSNFFSIEKWIERNEFEWLVVSAVNWALNSSVKSRMQFIFTFISRWWLHLNLVFLKFARYSWWKFFESEWNMETQSISGKFSDVKSFLSNFIDCQLLVHLTNWSKKETINRPTSSYRRTFFSTLPHERRNETHLNFTNTIDKKSWISEIQSNFWLKLLQLQKLYSS